jgi:hypothetical protein
MRARVMLLAMLSACAGSELDVGDDPPVTTTPVANAPWDQDESPMPQWACDVPVEGAPVDGTNRVYAGPSTVQAILDTKCLGCHDGQVASKARPLGQQGIGGLNRLYRWFAYPSTLTAGQYAPQIVEALRDNGDDQKQTSSYDGAMWNLSQITPSERYQVSDYFAYCADHPRMAVMPGLGTPVNHYLTGRSYVTGINWPNPNDANPSDPGINNCLDFTGNCVVDESGLALKQQSDPEMARFYKASKQDQLTTLGRWIAERTPRFVRKPGEGIDAFRDRTKTAVYYNQNELALGRELWCDTWPAGCSNEKGGTVPVCNLACGVTNYGFTHNDLPNALGTAIRRRSEKNTVVISYNRDLAMTADPTKSDQTLGAGYAVQFAAYGPTGNRLDKAQLDYQGPRPASYICTNCHGGWYDPTVHLVYQAKLLPANPHDVRFSDSQPSSYVAIDSGLQYSRTNVQTKFQAINELMYNWVKFQETQASPHFTAKAEDRMLLPAQVQWFEAMYCGNVAGCSQGNGNGGPYAFTSTVRHVAPVGWQMWGQWGCNDPKSQLVRDLYHYVVQPFCIGCHNAFIDAPFSYPPSNIVGSKVNSADFGGSNPLVDSSRFVEQWPSIEKYFIRNARMPHAEHALKAFWTMDLTTDGTPSGDPLPTYDCGGNINGVLTLDGTRTGAKYHSPKELLYHHMAQPGMSGLTIPEPFAQDAQACDAWGPGMCGPSNSGRACINHACVDHCDFATQCPVPINSSESVNPNREQCVAATQTCEPCGRAGQKVCLVGAATGCDTFMNPGCMDAGLSRCETWTTEFSQFSSPDPVHAYADVDRCLVNLVDRNAKEVDSNLWYPGLIPTDPKTNTMLPTSNGTPAYGLNFTYPVPAGSVPSFASFTLASTAPSAGVSAEWCANNCVERGIDGNAGQYFDSTAPGGGYLEVDLGRNRSVFAVELARENTLSSLLDDTNVWVIADGGSWQLIPAANGYGAGSYTINGFPPNTQTVRVKVPVAMQPIRKVRIRRQPPFVFTAKQIRIGEVKLWGY